MKISFLFLLLILSSCKENESTSSQEIQTKKQDEFATEQMNSANADFLVKYASEGDFKQIKFLVSELKADVNRPDKAGMTALLAAAEKEDIKIIEFLIASGANVNAVGGRLSESALKVACRKANFEISELLINKGANVNLVDKYGITPFAAAAAGGNINIVKLLVNQGADMKTKGGNSPALFNAAEAGHVEVVKYLLENGAVSDINYQDDLGHTPLTASFLHGGHATSIPLIDAKPNLKLKDKEGKSVLQIAKYEGVPNEIIEALEKAGAQ